LRAFALAPALYRDRRGKPAKLNDTQVVLVHRVPTFSVLPGMVANMIQADTINGRLGDLNSGVGETNAIITNLGNHVTTFVSGRPHRSRLL